MPTALPSNPFLTEDHLRLVDEVAEFTADRIAPLAGELEACGPHTDRRIRVALSETGWLGVLIRSEWGGLDLGHVAKTLMIETLSQDSPAAGAILQASVLGAAPIAEYGREDMRRTWLPEIAAGRCWPTIAVTDPNHGSHVLGMAATARPEGDGYVLSGEKVLVGNAAIGDIHCVVVRTGEPRDWRGLTAFLVEKETEGLEIVPQSVNGLYGFSVDTLRMTDVRVPQSHIIGRVGDGSDVAQRASVVYGRLNLASVALGIHRRMLDVTAQHVSTRPRYDGHLSDLDPVRRRLAEMKHQLMLSETAVYYAANLLDRGEACDPWLYHAKLTAHRAGEQASGHAKQLHGGHAGRLGSPIEQLRRDIDLPHAPAGPDDLQLKRLAEDVVGPQRPQWSAQHAARRLAPA